MSEEAGVRPTETADEPPPAPPPGGLALLLRSLRSRNYRLFFGGQGISLTGTWMQQVAVSWLAYRLTGSALILGTLGLVSQLPTLLFAPVAGVMADRWNLRRTLVLTQALAAVQALVLAVVTLTGVVTIWHLFALSICMGVINAFDMPTRQAFVPRMIERPEDLGNAIALNSTLVNASRLVGPALAGLLIKTIGEGPCFLLNAVSYVPVIGALLAMRLPPSAGPSRHPSLAHGMREGFVYAFGFPPIRAILLLLALTSLMGMSYGTVMPVFAHDVLGGGADTFGFLMGATGLGAGMMLLIASGNTVLQTIVDDDKRGRVMSIYTMAFLGMTPFGSMIAGSLAEAFGAPGALIVGGSCCLLGSVVFALQMHRLRPYIRPIYVRKGLIRETAAS